VTDSQPDGQPSSVPSRAPSHLREVLERGEFAVTAEIGPPRGASVSAIRRKARLLRDWVDAANITDNQSAVVRLASWAGCLVVLEEGLEPVMQLQCRDRNRIALQSDLLGAAAMKIPNVLMLTGDHPRFGDHPDARGVFDMDSLQLIWTARTMRLQRTLLSGRELKPAPDWFVGAVENPFAPPYEWRAERLGKKVAAGAEFCQTQFIYDVDIFRKFMQRVRDFGFDQRCFVLAGVGPIKSLRGLEFMRSEVPGMYVPDSIVQRLRGVPADRVADEGMQVCSDIIAEVKEIPGVAGVHVMAVSWEEAIPEILERAGLKPRQRTGEPVAQGS
jgi:methylenetetrahydrofolate reductase (NADPH)